MKTGRNFLKKLGNLLGIKKKSRKYSYLKQIKNKEFYIMKKKLYKSVKDRKLTGVCGGIEEYFDIDSSIVNSMACFDFLCRNGSTGLYYLCDSSILMNKIFLKKRI